MVAKTINKFYFFGVDADIKKEIIGILDEQNKVKPIDKHPRRTLYESIISDWNTGKYGDISLRQTCQEQGVNYEQVIKFHRKTE